MSIVSGPLSRWLPACAVLHAVPSVEAWIWYCAHGRLPSFGQHAHQVRHWPPPRAIATTYRRIPIAVMSRPASCACSSLMAWWRGSAPRGLVGEDDDPCVEGRCPGELQGCLGGLPEQQRSAADEDGVDHEVELVEELVLQQRLP